MAPEPAATSPVLLAGRMTGEGPWPNMCGPTERIDAEHVAGRGLILKRLLQLTLARLLGLKQARVLDGDDSLIGEGLHQADLTCSKWLNFRSVNKNNSQQLIASKHRDC